MTSIHPFSISVRHLPDWGLNRIYFIKRATSSTTSEIMMVDENGKEKTLPNSLKRRSPGNLPMPSFSSHGSNAENMIKPINITTTQRIILFPLVMTYSNSQSILFALEWQKKYVRKTDAGNCWPKLRSIIQR
jgi:hypothetical protein